jgi:hypothetical protein
MTLSAPLNAGTSGTVTLAPFSSGRNIDLGTNTANTLGLSTAELGQVTATTLIVGDTVNTGNVQITQSITPAVTNLVIRAGGSVNETNTGSLGVGNVAVQAGTGITLNTATNSIGTFAATSATGNIALTDGAPLTVGNVNGVNGVTATTGNITLTDDDMTISAAITATAGRVTLQPLTAGRPIDVGLATTPNALDLLSTAITQVTATTLQIGSATAGNLTLTALVAPLNGVITLVLQSGGLIGESGNGAAIVTNLAAEGAGGVSLATNPSTVTNLAGTTSNAMFSFTNSTPLTIGTVDGVYGVNAGTGGDVNLTVGGGATTGILKGQNPNDNIPEVTGRTVTLTALGPTNGSTGQIGFFTTSAQFFEVAATTINASTNGSRLWISAIGGAAVGSISAGSDFAILKTVGGNLTSTHTGASVTTPDVTGGTVLLLSPVASGSFGTSANPLQVQTSNLSATVSGTGNTGSINVRNVAAGSNLNVTAASTVNGDINLTVAGGNLTTTAASGTDINAPANTVTLNVSGAIVSGTGAGVTDVAAANLAVTSATGIGTSANPLKTALTNASATFGGFAASVGLGGVFVSNTSAALNIDTVAGVSGVTAAGGAITISTSANLTVSRAVTTASSGINAGAVNLSGSGTIALDAALTGSTVTVQGGNAGNQFLVEVTGTVTTVLNTGTGSNSLYVSSMVGNSGNLAGLHAALTVNGAGSNILVASEAGASAADTVTVTDHSIAGGSGSGFTINYAPALGGSFSGINFADGTGNDRLNIQSTLAGAITGILNFGGADTLDVCSNTVTNMGDLSGLKGMLVLEPVSGTDLVVVSEAARATADTVMVTNQGLTSTAGSGFQIAFQSLGGTFSGVNFATGTGNDAVTVQSLVTGTPPLSLYNFGGHDTVNVNVASASGYNALVNVQAGSDTLNVSDVSGGAVIHNFPSGAGSGKLQVLYPSTPGGLESDIFYQGVTQLSTSPPVS